ncbi:MAG: flavin reductase [Selenomonadaceae bacterium]|nr:flavin reductase [Selenomonadaceae bacterium]
MENKAMFRISYGLYVLTANADGKDNGCIINTVTQVTSEPNQITIAVNKNNFTQDMIAASDRFTVSIISEAASFNLFKRFGFQSGRTVDKFSGFGAAKRLANGTLAITEGTNAYISAEVFRIVDVGTHTVFFAKVSDAVILNDTPSATYNYYQAHIKPKPENTVAKGKTIWRCSICNYEYEGEELPPGYICPICKHPASDFVKVTG